MVKAVLCVVVVLAAVVLSAATADAASNAAYDRRRVRRDGPKQKQPLPPASKVPDAKAKAGGAPTTKPEAKAKTPERSAAVKAQERRVRRQIGRALIKEKCTDLHCITERLAKRAGIAMDGAKEKSAKDSKGKASKNAKGKGKAKAAKRGGAKDKKKKQPKHQPKHQKQQKPVKDKQKLQKQKTGKGTRPSAAKDKKKQTKAQAPKATSLVATASSSSSSSALSSSAAALRAAAYARVRYHCVDDPPTWDDLKHEFKRLQREDNKIGLLHVQSQGVNDDPANGGQRLRLDFWKAALAEYSTAVRNNPGLAQPEKVQLVLRLFSQFEMGELPQVPRFGGVGTQPETRDPFAEIIRTIGLHDKHHGSDRRDQRQTVWGVQVNALRGCLMAYLAAHLDALRDQPEVHLHNFPWRPFNPDNEPYIHAHSVALHAGGGDSRSCGNVPVMQYTGALPGQPQFAYDTMNNGYGITADLRTAVGAGADTWAFVPYQSNHCWYSLVPNTARVWATPALSGCYVFVAADANDNLLVLHANVNRIPVQTDTEPPVPLPMGRDANSRAKLDCIVRALAAHPTYTPRAQLQPAMYMAPWGQGGIPHGINTTPGVAGGWRYYYQTAQAGHTPNTRRVNAVNEWPPCNGGVGGVCEFTSHTPGAAPPYVAVSPAEERTSNSPAICKGPAADDGTW